MKIRTMCLLLMLIVLPVTRGSIMDLIRRVFQMGKNDLEKSGLTYPTIYSGVRSQPRVPDYVPFPCNVRFGRSPNVPDSVHRLRPGDIDVVGGLGDSLVAGSGALEEFAIGTFIEARGVSWCVGGQGDWRRFLTVPNMLKYSGPNTLVSVEGIMNSEKYKAMQKEHLARKLEKVHVNDDAIFQQDSASRHVSKIMLRYFKDKKITILEWPGNSADLNSIENLWAICKVFNPNLIGYSTGTGEFISSKAKLNIAFPVAATEDALHQARILVQRIKRNPEINVRKQWKLITIFFGANDICSAQCFSPVQFSPGRYAHHLRRVLDFLKMSLPRTLVNLVPVIDVTVSVRVPKSAMCNILHPLYCACMHRGSRPDIAASKMSQYYQQAVEALIYSGRYDKSPDFTVVLQPFIKAFNAPNADPTKAKRIDPSLVTYDCFHFSQKGHALGANLLWNNMLEPVGNKTDQGLPEVFERVLCPSERTPYIFTNVNSRYFRLTGSQVDGAAR